MNSQEIQIVKDLLSSPKKITIVPHRSPDGDAMGATLGLYHLLLQMGHSPVVIAPNDFPEFLAWMPGSENVLVFEKDIASTTAIMEASELIFTLDFNALHRVGEMENVLRKLKAPFVMIDHHEKPDDYALVAYSDTSFGSTCEMLYNFIIFLDTKHLINTAVATCIYTGILTDSGSFRFPKTTGTTHRIVAELIDRGADNVTIPTLLFDNNSYERLQLVGRALQNMKVLPEHKTAYTSLSQQELDSFNYVKGDSEGIVNYGLTIKGVHFAVIFIEHRDENIIKISFRSQGGFDVNQFAREYFNGGGHINAAGGKSYLSLKETINKFETIIQSITVN